MMMMMMMTMIYGYTLYKSVLYEFI